MRTLALALALTTSLIACDGGEEETDSGTDVSSDSGSDDGGDTDDGESTDDTETTDEDEAVCDTTTPYIDCRRNGTSDNGGSEVIHYDDQGRRVSRTYNNGQGGGNVNETWSYTGDLLSSYTRDQGNNTVTVDYTYDTDGNLTASTDGWTYTYDSQGRQASRTYDANGDSTPEESCTRNWSPSNASWTWEDTCTAWEDFVERAELDPVTEQMVKRERVIQSEQDGEVTETHDYQYRDDCQQTFIFSTWGGPNSGDAQSEYQYNADGQVEKYLYNGMYGGGEWTYTYTCGEDEQPSDGA